MPIRTQQDLASNPCLYKLKDFERNISPQTNSVTNKIKKMIPKLDENGNIIYKTISIPVKKGCACKGNQKTEIQKQTVPEMVEAWVDVTTTLPTSDDNKFVICKLYGTVKRSLCENCKTYKKK
jgi:hypothetical protein